ncbi:chromosome transmission fidelity protein 18 homolog, partial [Tachysurus ichikawai]
ESHRNVKVSEFRQKKQTFEEALTSADTALTNTDTAEVPEHEEDEALTPKAKKRKQDVAKKLHFEATRDEITPPSSPEVYQRSERTRYLIKTLY